jgi:hypothetical protein
MLFKQLVINIPTAALSGCICPINVPGEGNVTLFPKTSLQRFFLKGCCKHCLNAFKGVQWLGFKNRPSGSG